MNFLSQIFGFFKSFQCWVTIAPWESGLRVRLGKTATVLNPGPHWRIPFLDRMFVQPVRMRAISNGGLTVTTKDGKPLTLAIAVVYQIADILKLHAKVANPETTLLYIVQGIINELVSHTDSHELTQDKIRAAVASGAPKDWGLSNIEVVIQSFVYARAIRLMNYEYQTTSSTNNLASTTDIDK